MKKILVLIVLILSFAAAVSAQDKQLNIFTKAWVYPDIPESKIKNDLIETARAAVCQALPSDSLRVFGNIRGMGFDKNDNLYVWDDGYQALWKFLSDGKKSWRKKYEKDGKAEGTFINVGPAFAVAEDGQICLGDKGNRTISLLDSSGKFIRRFKVEMMPAAITFGKDGSVYVTGFGFTYKGDLVQHFSSGGEFLGAFCKREADSKAIDFSGNSGRLSTDKEGNIYYSHFYPYRVEMFSKDGQLLKMIEKTKDNFLAPRFGSANGSMSVDCTSGLKGMTYIPQGYLSLIVYQDIRKDQWNMEILDLDGNVKASLPKTEYPMSFMYRSSACDSKGNLYYDINTNAEPVIVKYSVNYKELTKD